VTGRATNTEILKTMNMKQTSWLAALAIIGTVAGASAQVPGIIQYQGRVTSNGTNFTGYGEFKFAIIETAVTGDSLWSNDGTSVMGGEPNKSVTVPVQDGLFIVGLGDTALGNMMTIPASIFSYQNVNLRIWFSDGVGPYAALSPDQPITSVGFAMMAERVGPNSIGSAQLQDGAVTGGKIAPDAVAGLNLLNQTITGAKIVPNTITSTQLADAITLQRLDLGGPLWNGSLSLWASGANETRIDLSGDGNGSLFNMQFGNNATGIVFLAKNAGSALGMWDIFGGPGVLAGMGANGGGELSLFQINGTVGIFLDADKSIYGLPSSGGEIEIRDGSGSTRVFLDGDNGAGAGRIDVRNSTGQTSVQIEGESGSGGRIQLRTTGGPTKVDLLGSGVGSGGEIRVYDNPGNTETVEILGAETASTGGQIALRRADGTDTIILDAENDGQGGPRIDLNTGDGTSMMVFLPGGGDATLAGGGLMRLGEFDGNNLAIDADEIFARTNGAAAPLRLNYGYSAPVVMTRLAINTLTPAAGYELSVNGQVICEELVVQNSSDWPDYVFADDYNLRSLEEVEASIKQNRHLPGIPSAKEVGAAGISIGEMQKQMMEKIEELTLYVIEQNKRLKAQESELEALRARLQPAN